MYSRRFFIMFFIFSVFVVLFVVLSDLTFRNKRLRIKNNILQSEKIHLQNEITLLNDSITHINNLYDGFNELDLLIFAIIDVESGGCETAKGAKNCNGLMQVMGGSFDGATNIQQGAAILKSNIVRSINSEQIVHRALTAYNRGYAGANKYYIKAGKFESGYSNKVLRKYREYKEMQNAATSRK